MNYKINFSYFNRTYGIAILAVPIFAMDYTVQSGDTLYLLSKKYNTTVSEIKDVNGLQGDKLLVGQKLNIPTNE